MTFNPDDPKWTAYVLGELEASDRAEMESLLESSEDARAYVEELRIAAGVLEQELKVELKVGFPPEINAGMAAELTDAQRAAIQAAAGSVSSGAVDHVLWFRRPQVHQAALALLAVAAVVLVAVAMPHLWKSTKTVDTAKSAVSPSAPEQKLNATQGQSNSPVIAETRQGAADVSNGSVEKASQETLPAATPVPSSPPARIQITTDPKSVATVPAPAAGLPAANSIITDVFPPLVAQGGGASGGIRANITPSGISGVVRDSSGALIPGVTVTATNTETGVVRTVISSDSGTFSFAGLAPGPYRLNAMLSGFQTAMLVNIKLGPAESQRFDIAMKIGSSAGTAVAVVDSNSVLAQSSSSVGAVLSENQVNGLPLLGNNVLNLIGTLQGTESQTFTGLSASSVNTVRDGLTVNNNRLQNGVFGTSLGVDPASSLNTNVITGDALLNLPDNQDDLLAYLTQLAQLRGGAGEATLSVDGFNGGNLPPQAQTAPINPQGQGQGQGQQGQRGAGAGGGRGAAGGARGGAAAPAGAPPPPPPSPAARAATPAPGRIIPDNPTVIGGLGSGGRYTPPNTASYAPVTDNPFRRVSQEPLSTFSSDVDTASYANLRRFINQNQLPPPAAVRIEEMINYFNYDYAQPSGRDPIGAQMEIASAPWNPGHRLVRIGIKARDIDGRRRPSTNLVFLIDVSGSMQPQERLPLIKSGLKMLVENLTENDHVSMVVYASASGVVLPYTSGNRKDIIMNAIDRLEAGGSTNGGAGIQQAYQIAASNFIPGGVNRVILATDGDFNVGVTNQTELTRLVQDRARSGVFLSVLGVGTDNLKDSTMERLADNGNGNYAYLDSLNEAYKVLVQQMGGTLVTVAKDVKLQVEFNPSIVEAYRLIGYENRMLSNSDFNNDRKDAGDMGAGHTVTALYELVPRGGSIPGPDVDPLKYQTQEPAARPPAARSTSNETLTLKIRYKDPDGTESKLLSLPLMDREGQFSKASTDFRFAAAVAEFGMLLRDSPYRGRASVADVLDNAQGAKGQDRNGYRQEFIQLVQRARSLASFGR